MIISNEHGNFNTEDVLKCEDVEVLLKYLKEAKMSAQWSEFKRAEALKEKIKAEKTVLEYKEKEARCQMATALQNILVLQIENKIEELNEPLPSTVIERVLGEE